MGATLNNLGALYTVTGAFARAEAALARALAIRERRKSASHPDGAVTLNNLSLLTRRMLWPFPPSSVVGPPERVSDCRCVRSPASARPDRKTAPR